MVNGLYTASRGMTNILAKQDIHAQNMANATTNGFKLARLVTSADVSIGRNDEGELKQKEMQKLSEVYTSFQQGPMIRTGNNFDVALANTGFFTVEGEDGSTRYTRNGGFSLNANGELVTLTGKRLLDDGGAPINVKGDNVQFMDDGSVFVDGKSSGKLGVVDFKDTRTLRYGADGLFSNSEPESNPALPAAAVSLKSGFLEGSNVDTMLTMVNMMADYRNYEADQKALKSIDETLGKAVTEVGRV
jgi:flagellar basal-body rod protein FlgF